MDEYHKIIAILRKKTGKSFSTCKFAYDFNSRNYEKAIKMLSDDNSEVGR